MGTLEVAIDALRIAANVFGIVSAPVAQGSLKSAAELASEICEQVQVRTRSLSCFYVI
jgi:hypothetical protein